MQTSLVPHKNQGRQRTEQRVGAAVSSSASEHASHLTPDLSAPPTSGTTSSRLQRANHLECQGTPSIPEPGKDQVLPRLPAFKNGFAEPDKDTALEWAPTRLLGPPPANYHFKQAASCVCWLLDSCSFQEWSRAFQNLPSEWWAEAELQHFFSPTNTNFASNLKKGNFKKLEGLSASTL